MLKVDFYKNIRRGGVYCFTLTLINFLALPCTEKEWAKCSSDILPLHEILAAWLTITRQWWIIWRVV